MTKKRINKKKRLSRKIQKGGLHKIKISEARTTTHGQILKNGLPLFEKSSTSVTVEEPITSLFYELKDPREGDELMEKSMAFQFLVDAVYNTQYPDNDIRSYFNNPGVERSISFSLMDKFLKIIVVDNNKIKTDELGIGDKSDIFYKLLTIIYYLLPYLELEDESLDSLDLREEIKIKFLEPLVTTLKDLLN